MAAKTEDKNLPSTVTGAGRIATISQRALAAVKIGDVEYEVEEQLTRPVLTQEEGVPIAVLFDGPIVQAKADRGKRRPGAVPQEPPHIAPITNLATGQLMTLIINAVLKSELEDRYPDAGYVGKAFALSSKMVPVKGGEAGQRMRIYDIKVLRATAP